MSHERIPSPRPSCRRLMGVRVLGTGSYVPDWVVTNDHLKERLGCDSEWIIKRTGILERRHAPPHQATSDLCYEAGRRCLDRAGVAPKDVDLLLIGTFTPDMTFARSAAVQFGGSAAAVAAVPISVTPAITPAPMRLRKNIRGSLVSWVIRDFAQRGPIPPPPPGPPGRPGRIGGRITSTPQPSSQYHGSAQYEG